MKRIFACLLVLFFISHSAIAQGKKGTMSGVVQDSLQKPVVYATVVLFDKANKQISSTSSDSKGAFILKADTGRYVLSISHAGFGNLTMDVAITAGENTMETVMLAKEVKVLASVRVTAVRPLIEQKDDKIIYNVENDMAAKAETATDILRKVPLVTVDGDGNVQLNGQGNFKVLLNGRETSMFAMNVKDALRGFPGATISKIEVITSPSAKYDAEGIGGIINIITKKRVVGYNGSFSSFHNTLKRFSETMSLNVKSGKLGVSTFMGIGGATGYLRNSSFRQTIAKQTASFSKRTLAGDQFSRSSGEFASVEVAYEVDSSRTLAFFGEFQFGRNKSYMDQTITTDYQQAPSDMSYLHQNSRFSTPSSGFGADYIQVFPKTPGKELSFRFRGLFSGNDGFNASSQDGQLKDRYVTNESKARNSEYTLQGDFVNPLKKGQKWETGLKVIKRSAYSDFKSLIKYAAADPYKTDLNNSNYFQYDQQVYSAYSSYFIPIKKLSIRTGLRVEHTRVDGDFKTSGTQVQQRYTNLVPNILLTYKVNPIYTLTGSYNMRLNRPSINNLNPFVNNNDSFNISYGNPDLGPQVIHSLSVNNRFIKGKIFLSGGVFASYTNNMIVQYAQFNQVTGVTSITYANVGREYQVSSNLNFNASIGTKLNFGVNAQLRYNNIENKSNILQSNSGVSGSAFTNFNYKVIGNFSISGSGGIVRNPYALVNSPNTLYFYQVNLGYKMMAGKLSVTMNVNNFHDKYQRIINITDDPAFTIINRNTNLYRVVYFGAFYNFGKLKENVSKKKGGGNDDLLN